MMIFSCLAASKLVNLGDDIEITFREIMNENL